MKLRPYQPDDYWALVSWLGARGITPWEREAIPEVGYLVSTEWVGVAMGFLRRIEGGGVMIDGLCTNPNVGSKDRDRAINLLVDKLISTAKELKCRGIVSFTEDTNTIERSKRFGFSVKTNQTIISLGLGGKDGVFSEYIRE